MLTPAVRPDRRRAARSLIVAVAACGLVSCGGSSSAPSRDRYAQQAGAICSSYSGQLSTLGSRLQSAHTQADIESTLQQAIKAGQQETDRLKGLQEPSGNDSAINAALRALQDHINELKVVLTAVQRNDQAGLQSAATGFQNDNSSVNDAFNNAGIPACGSGVT